MKEWWSATLTGVFFEKSLHKIIDYVIFAYSFNSFTTLTKWKSQNFHAILFYLIKKTKWSYILQIRNMESTKIITIILLYYYPAVLNGQHFQSWLQILMVFFQLDSISRKILLTADMPEYYKSADECKLWYCYYY